MGRNGEVGLRLWFFALFQFSHFYSVLESDPQFGFEEAKKKLQGMDTVLFGALSGSVEVKQQDRAVPG